jgi:hypothetical protein
MMCANNYGKLLVLFDTVFGLANTFEITGTSFKALERVHKGTAQLYKEDQIEGENLRFGKIVQVSNPTNTLYMSVLGL